MRIGAAAQRLGLPAHALRHWEDVGVVVPDRTVGGYRDYTDEHLHRLRVVRACQRAGLSLNEIRVLLHRDEQERAAVIRRRLDQVRAQRAELAATEAFLEHVVGCQHDLMTRCSDCRRYPPE